MTSIKISDIKVGKRHRKDLGDIAAFAENIAEIGLLHPLVVTPDNHLIAGVRRLAAFKLLGRDRIEAKKVDLDKIVRGEFAENMFRKNFAMTEQVAIKRALEPLERAAAKERQKAGGRAGGKAGGKLPQASKGKSRDKVAKLTGTAARTLAKAEEVVAAAEAEPEKFGKLAEEMDRTGRVNGVHRRLKIIRQSETIRAEPPPLPGNGPYRVIVADPPWATKIRGEDPSSRRAIPYPGQSIDDICKLDVPSIAHQDCALWLWTTNADIRNAFTVLDAWGFEHKTILTWAKPKMGLGDWLRGQTEHCIMAVRGKPVVQLTNQTTLLMAPVGEHSAKPDEFYALVEALCPAPRYAELFSRRQYSDKWDCHGDEAVNGGEYDAEADFAGSIDVAYEAVRARVAAGGQPWVPKSPTVTDGSSEPSLF